MASISFFQRYSGSENHSTNNTMLMLRYVQQQSTTRFQRILASLIASENAPLIGPRFAQQEKVGAAIPDAVIDQESFHVYFEAKASGATLDSDQIANHVAEIGKKHPRGSAYLVGLSRDPWKEAETSLEDREEPGVQFIPTTYDRLLLEIEAASAGDDVLMEIVGDYRAYIASQNLLPTHAHTMVAFPCNDTASDNVATGVYFQPASRNRKQDQASVVGIYRKQCITHVGRLSAVAVCRTEDGKLIVDDNEMGELTEEQKNSVREAITRGHARYGNFAVDPHRFYIVDRFVEANFQKATPYGMSGHRYFDLEKVTGRTVTSSTPIAEIANSLRKTTFQ